MATKKNDDVVEQIVKKKPRGGNNILTDAALNVQPGDNSKYVLLGMKLFKERFRDFDYNVRLLQKIALRPELTKQFGPDAGAVMGVVLCALLTESVEGLEWNTYINGKVEAPVLMYGDVCVARPMLLFGKQGELLAEVKISDIVEEIHSRIEEASC